MRNAAFRPKGKFYPFVRTIVTPVALGVCLLSHSAAASAAPDTRAIALHKYETLKTRVMGNDLTVDWAEFRAVAVDAGLEAGFDWHPLRERVLSDLAAGKTESALAGAQTIVAHNMANPEGHLLVMMVYQQLGLESAADREHQIVGNIVNSIMSSGDGLSAQHALSTVSASEEEFVVNMVLDADTESEASVRKDGVNLDRRTVRGEDGAEHVLWFHSSVQPVAVAANVLPQ